MVSHDSSFLNNTITDVLHLNRFKLKRYRGNLEAFVKAVPEATSYYTLEAAEDYKFKFPDPLLLEGVKTKEKSLLKMRKVGFQYPGTPAQQLYSDTIQAMYSDTIHIVLCIYTYYNLDSLPKIDPNGFWVTVTQNPSALIFGNPMSSLFQQYLPKSE